MITNEDFNKYYELYHNGPSLNIDEHNKNELCSLFMTTYDKYYMEFCNFKEFSCRLNNQNNNKNDHKVVKIIISDKNDTKKHLIEYVNELFAKKMTEYMYTVNVQKIVGRNNVNEEEYYWIFREKGGS